MAARGALRRRRRRALVVTAGTVLVLNTGSSSLKYQLVQPGGAVSIVDGIVEPDIGTISLPIGRFAELKIGFCAGDEPSPAQRMYITVQGF